MDGCIHRMGIQGIRFNCRSGTVRRIIEIRVHLDRPINNLLWGNKQNRISMGNFTFGGFEEMGIIPIKVGLRQTLS